MNLYSVEVEDWSENFVLARNSEEAKILVLSDTDYNPNDYEGGHPELYCYCIGYNYTTIHAEYRKPHIVHTRKL